MTDVAAHVGAQPVVKITKAAAEYEHPARGKDHCSMCEYFEEIEKDHCSRVRGIILAGDWCKLFERKN
jgi:hypothetical protein